MNYFKSCPAIFLYYEGKNCKIEEYASIQIFRSKIISCSISELRTYPFGPNFYINKFLYTINEFKVKKSKLINLSSKNL